MTVNADVTFRLLRGHDGLTTLKSSWESLQALNDSACFFQTYEWYSCIAESLLADIDDFLLVIATLNNEVVGIFPLQLANRVYRGVDVVQLQFPTHSHAVLRDFLVHPSLRDVGFFPQLISYLRRTADFSWDIMRLEKMPSGSCAERLAAQEPLRAVISAPHGSMSEIRCSDRENATLNHLSGRFRRNICRMERKAEKQGALTFVPCADKSCLEEAFRLFMDIENDSWKGDAGSSIASDIALQRFYELLVDRDSGDMKIQINLLRIGSETVAAQFGVVSDSTYYVLKIGYRQDYSSLGPGNLILAQTVRHFSLDPQVRAINLVTSPEWARKWKSHSAGFYKLTAFGNTIKGKAICIAYRSILWVRKLELALNWERIGRNRPRDLIAEDNGQNNATKRDCKGRKRK